MRVKFPEGSGGPYEVPGVGRVIGGEEFDWPEDQPPIAGAVLPDGSPVPPADDSAGEDGAGEDGAAGSGAGEDQAGGGEGAEDGSEPQGKPRAKGARS